MLTKSGGIKERDHMRKGVGFGGKPVRAREGRVLNGWEVAATTMNASKSPQPGTLKHTGGNWFLRAKKKRGD